MSRKLAREVAFKIVFSNNFKEENLIKNDDELKSLINVLVKDKEFASESQNNEETKRETITAEDEKYISDIVSGVLEKTEELDEKIKKYLKGWTMDRIGRTDLAILRIAVYEILFREDIPYKVSVNEAVELAKLFCDDGSPAFINGVLAGIIGK